MLSQSPPPIPELRRVFGEKTPSHNDFALQDETLTHLCAVENSSKLPTQMVHPGSPAHATQYATEDLLDVISRDELPVAGPSRQRASDDSPHTTLSPQQTSGSPSSSVCNISLMSARARLTEAIRKWSVMEVAGDIEEVPSKDLPPMPGLTGVFEQGMSSHDYFVLPGETLTPVRSVKISSNLTPNPTHFAVQDLWVSGDEMEVADPSRQHAPDNGQHTQRSLKPPAESTEGPSVCNIFTDDEIENMNKRDFKACMHGLPLEQRGLLKIKRKNLKSRAYARNYRMQMKQKTTFLFPPEVVLTQRRPRCSTTHGEWSSVSSDVATQ